MASGTAGWGRRRPRRAGFLDAWRPLPSQAGRGGRNTARVPGNPGNCYRDAGFGVTWRTPVGCADVREGAIHAATSHHRRHGHRSRIDRCERPAPGADARQDQAARRPGGRHQGRLQAVRLSRPQRRHRRLRARSRQGRGRPARRAARTGAGGVGKPHAVPAAGQDRPHDRHHERDGRAAARRSASSSRATTPRASMCSPTARSPSRRWEALKGQKVCGIQGAWYNKYVAEKYGADIVAFRGQTEAETALLAGQLHRLALRRHGFPGAARGPEMGGVRDAAGDHPVRAVGRRGQARGARRAVGPVHGQDHRRTGTAAAS